MNEDDLFSIIFDAIEDVDNETALKYLLSEPNALHMDTLFGSWLHVAASAGNLFLVKQLIDNGINIDIKGGVYDSTALTEAAAEGHDQIVKYLLEEGSVLDLETSITNPLISAIIGNHIEVVKLLVAHGIDFNKEYDTQSKKNKTALMFAQERKLTEIENLLSSNKHQNKIKEDCLSRIDAKAILQAADHAKKLLGIIDLKPDQETPQKIQLFLENEKELQENDFIALGALWAQVVIKEKNWEWVNIKTDNWSSIGIVDKCRKYLILPLSFIKQSNSDTLLLYNSIIDENLPPSNEKNYLILS